MARRHSARTALGFALAAGLTMAATHALTGQETPRTPLTLGSTQISIAGTSNIHAYTASTTAVRLNGMRLAGGLAGSGLWDEVLKPGAVEAFEVVVPAESLSSPKDGLDKNMHKALKVKEHPEIAFRLRRLESKAGTPGAYLAVGVLRIAGVEREVALEIATERRASALAIRGQVQLLMTDYGITPPKAMLGMLKTDPKVTVTFETILTTPLT